MSAEPMTLRDVNRLQQEAVRDVRIAEQAGRSDWAESCRKRLAGLKKIEIKKLRAGCQ